MEALLNSVYLDPASSAYMSGSSAVFREAKKIQPDLKLQDVVEYLQTKDVYTLHKPVRKRFQRNRVQPDGLDSDWQGDLICLPSLREYNANHGYILICVDVLSKFMFAEPVETKKPSDVRDAFKTIIERSGRRPWRLTTDKGLEFRGLPFREFLGEQRIMHFCANNPDVKASVAERAVRTLKTRLFKHLTYKGGFSFLKILPRLVKAINSSVSRVTGLAPKDITPANAGQVLERVFGVKKIHAKFKFALGDVVRISKEKHLMEKGYVPNYTSEKFIIKELVDRQPPVYRLVDEKGEEIIGIFYGSELSKCLKGQEPASGKSSAGKSQKV